MIDALFDIKNVFFDSKDLYCLEWLL